MAWVKRWWWAPLLVIALAAGGFLLWAESTPSPMAEALAALEDSQDVAVQTEPWYTFQPRKTQSTTGLILYPGGRVDPRSYAPLAHGIAAQGYLVVIVPMPLNLAVAGVDRAAQVQATYAQIEHWAIGGHSLGGAMACRYVKENPGAVDGLVLWATYPAEGDDLSARDLAVVSIYGTKDGLATPDEIQVSRDRLPPETTWVRIEGGNHAQFGWYGTQPRDNRATISRRQQTDQILAATVELLARLQ
jgi:hypothetical protein